MHLYRKTAVVQLELFSGAEAGSLPLATERDFGVIFTVNGVTSPAQNFRSPINDEQWRQFDSKLRDCNTQRDKANYRLAAAIRSLAHQLYESMVELSPVLRDFLGRTGEPRRLVIQTTRPELHLLPWAAMIDDTGAFLAAGDLSVVQCWDKFIPEAAPRGNRLRLMSVLGRDDTNVVTAASLENLPGEIEQMDGSQAWKADTSVQNVDILHLEEHGNAVTNEIGDVVSTALADTFANVPIALLWSCYSGAANSWGDSPALCLHRNKAGFVLSFLAELHNADAASISTAFYRDVFGPAASRDPETALVRIRANKFASEFPYANWASMTIYMRAPLDLSALPLNGPRVPELLWTADDAPDPAAPSPCPEPAAVAVAAGADGTAAAAGLQASTVAAAASPAPAVDGLASLWASLTTAVSQLQPGTLNDFHGFEDKPAEATAKLPKAAFKAWQGNVIRLDGASDPLNTMVLSELDLNSQSMPATDAAEQLLWFFQKVQRYGSPLIVWTNAAPRHMQFLKNIQLSSALTFLLMYGPHAAPTVIDLVNEGRLAEAQTACATLPETCGDDVLSAAYFAFARSQDAENAVRFIRRVSSKAERLLLIANFISRRGVIPNPRPDWMLNHPEGKLTNLQQQHCQEECFREVISHPGTEAPERESGRAKHEFGYLMQTLGKAGVAEMLYGQALADLEKCKPEYHDYRWHDAIGRLLRDWADLLSRSPDRLDTARGYLDRAMAIHSFHGRRLQIAYCLNTTARIALTGGRYSEAIVNAVDAANLFELLKNWSGWGEALKILFDSLAETRQPARMHSLADLAIDKLEGSNLAEEQRHRLRRFFTYEKANANWIAGRLAEARSELEKLGMGASDGTRPDLDPEFETEVKRLWNFLALGAQ
jgi:hypothetical protein